MSFTQSYVVPKIFCEILSEVFSWQSFIIIHVNKHRGHQAPKWHTHKKRSIKLIKVGHITHVLYFKVLKCEELHFFLSILQIFTSCSWENESNGFGMTWEWVYDSFLIKSAWNGSCNSLFLYCDISECNGFLN